MAESREGDFGIVFWQKVELLEFKMIIRVKVFVEEVGSVSFEFVESLVLMFGRGL